MSKPKVYDVYLAIDCVNHSLAFLPPTRLAPRCFEKSLPRSLFYMARDMGCLLALHYLYPQYVAGNWPLTFLWWNATGFMLWALFVIGESRERGTVCRSPTMYSSPRCVFRTRFFSLAKK